uniref:Radical SAM core domain-containing protein n=1 Tax=Oryza meridionalis TaxID=40149 RepID=A0A0E0CWT9_9ORYZ
MSVGIATWTPGVAGSVMAHAHSVSVAWSWQVVNLIPFNPIGSSSNFKTSSEHNVKKFQKILRGIYNIRTTIRQQMGQDIAGACGQLVVSLPDERSAGGATLLSDIEDIRI